MTEQQKPAAVHFAVDLSKAEYVSFYKVVTQFSSASTVKRIGLFLVLAMVAVPYMSLYRAYGIEALLTWDALSLLIPAALLLFYNFAVMPWLRIRQAEKGYDTAVSGGQVFAGTVTVNDRSVIKTTVSGSVTMSFSDKILFFEQEDMLVFVNTAGRGIVLPARCMTADTANAVRALALSALPPAFCKCKAPIRCTRVTPFEIDPPAPVKTLFEAAVSYSDADSALVIKELSRRAVRASVPSGCVIGFLLALLIANEGAFATAAIVFWLTVVVVVGYAFFGARARAKFTFSSQNFRFTFKVTEKAVIADGGERRGVTAIPWKEMRHAVEGDTILEFYSRYGYIAVPKRLIDDMDSFRALVDACRKERNE